MALPTGAGTETLHAHHFADVDGTTPLILGVQHHVYTILSIIFCDVQEASGSISIRVNDGSNDIMLLSEASHASKGPFVWNDKFVMLEDDDLDVYNSVNNGDWYVSYIDQDWS